MVRNGGGTMMKILHALVVIACLVSPASSQTLAGQINIKSYGAKGDNSTNDTGAMQSALNACSTSGCSVYVPYGIYLTTTTLNIARPMKFFSDAAGTTIKFKAGTTLPANTPIIRIKPSGAALAYVEVAGFILDGSSASTTNTGQWNPGVAVQSADPYLVSDVRVHDLHVKETFGDCITVEAITSPFLIRPKNIYVYNNVCEHWLNIRQGVAVTGGENVFVYANSFSSHTGTGYAFDEEINAGETIQNLQVFGNTVSSTVSNGFAVNDSSLTAAGVLIYGNVVQSTTPYHYSPNSDMHSFGNSVPGAPITIDDDNPAYSGNPTLTARNLFARVSLIVAGTATVQGAAFSVNTQDLAVVNGNVGISTAVPTFSTGGGLGIYGASTPAVLRLTRGATQGFEVADIGSELFLGYFGQTAGAQVRPSGGIAPYSRTIAQLKAITPETLGLEFYCSNCSPAKIVISTGGSAGNFADAAGGQFQ